MPLISLLFLLQPTTQHVESVCATMLDAKTGGPAVVCLDKRVVVRWEVRR